MKFKVHTYLSGKFRKYQDKALDEKQAQLIDSWFAEKESAGNKPLVLLQDRSRTALKESLRAGILDGIAREERKHWYQHRWIGVAAMLLLLSSVTLLLFLPKDPTQQQAHQLAYTIYKTGKAEVKKIMLPDGSTIWMNAATRISVPQRFTTFNTRDVKLEHGEAFFQVKRDTLKPFRIKTGKYLTTVLGTSFNIRSYAGENMYQVAVRTGKVKVEKMAGKGMALLSAGLIKGQILDDNKQTNRVLIKNGNTANLMAWTTRRYLYLEDMDLLQIGKALERHYGLPVNVRIGNAEKSKYTLTFSQATIAEAVQQLALKTGINYQLTKHSLIIKTGR